MKDQNFREKITAFFDGLKPKGDVVPLTVNDVGMSFKDGLNPREMDVYDAYIQNNQPSTGNLPLSAYYPDSGAPTASGNYSGRIVGSNTTYAPGGGLVPLGMIDAREKALQDAAVSKAKEVNDFMGQFAKNAPTSDLVNINEDLTDQYFRHIDSSMEEALRKTKGDPNAAINLLRKDPNFNTKLKSFHDFSKTGNVVAKQIAEVQKDLSEGKVIPPALRMSMNRMLTVSDPSSPEFKNYATEVRRMNADMDFYKYMDGVMKNMVASEMGDVKDWSDPETNRIYKEKVSFLSKEQKEAVMQAAKDRYSGLGIYDDNYIEKNVKALVDWTKREESLTVSNKPKDGDAELLLSPETDEANVVTGNVLQGGKETITDSEGNVTTEPISGLRPANFSVYDQATFDKPVKPVIAISALGSDLTTGEKIKGSGNVSAEIGSVSNARVYDGLTGDLSKYNGMMVDDDAPLSEKALEKTKYVPVVAFKYKKKNSQGVEQEKSAWVPLSTVENALLGKNKKNKKAFDELKKRADKRNEKTKSKPKSKDPLGLGI